MSKLLFEELVRRKSSKLSLSDYCFTKQLNFIKDESPFKVGVCGRRGGKTTGCTVDLSEYSANHPDRVNLYITLSRVNAKRLIWPQIKKLNLEKNLGGIANESELSMTYPSGSVLYLTGAKDKTAIENFRGLALGKVYIDEAQSFRSYIEEMIDDVLGPTLFDYNGSLALIGTPAPIPAGYFYEMSKNPQWSHHTWTMFDNPFLPKKSGKTHQELLQRELTRRGVDVNDPKIQREIFAKWIADLDSLVFKYDDQKNHYHDLPNGNWRFLIGIDIGFDDCDAIAVLAWCEEQEGAYLVEEHVQNRNTISELANEIQKRVLKYNPDQIVMDTGGLGKKIAEEISKRHAIPIKAAEKQRKFEYIELLNDAMRTQKFFAKKESRFAQDCMLVEWEPDNKEKQRLKISDRYHSDINDAVLYVFRESLHWMYEEPKKIHKYMSPEWLKEEEQKLIKDLEDQMQGDKDWEWL